MTDPREQKVFKQRAEEGFTLTKILDHKEERKVIRRERNYRSKGIPRVYDHNYDNPVRKATLCSVMWWGSGMFCAL